MVGNTQRRALAILVTAILVASCGSTPTPSGAPSAASSPAGLPGQSDGTPIGSSPATGPDASPGPQSGLIVTEVGFTPRGSDPAFVEISDVGSGTVDLTGAILRVGTVDVALGGQTQPLPPGGQDLVLFDGRGTVDAAGIHAPSGVALAPAGGIIRLIDASGRVLDHVAWGDGQPDSVRLSAGALVPDAILPGTTIGREPGATGPGLAEEWVIYGPDDASPGRANPMPTAGVLLPLSGSVVQDTHAVLAWYPVVGASTYHVQVAAVTDVSFGAPVLDTTTTDPQIDTGTLGPGGYTWRVATTDAAGHISAFSAPSSIALAGPTALAIAAVAHIGGSPLVADDAGHQLDVPLLSQHKDTAMLSLEQNQQNGPHAWNVDHGVLDPRDPADNENCALASVAMVNHFFGGDLSQDRIGFELYKDRQPGPEEDLNHGYGLHAADVTKALTFALGTAPEHGATGRTPDEIWAAVTASIDAGRPVVVAGIRHVFVFTGYAVKGGKRLLSVNDPWNYPGRPGTGAYDIDANDGRSASILDTWILPAGARGTRQEPSVTTDSDGDGVVDFDETQRFQTNPNDPDSDGDGVHDLQDIASGVFDPTYGYARDPQPDSPGRDFDVDGIPTERDPDSDAGGCQDGHEDANGNGLRDTGETWNFDASDDLCVGWRGTMTGTYTWDSPAAGAKGTASSTFSGLWEPVPADQPVDPCQGGFPATCIVYLPSGTVDWTWDSHQVPPGGQCDEHRSGHVAAGAVNDPRNAGGANGVPLSSQMLVLEPDGAGHLTFRGQGITALTERMTCSDVLHAETAPPAYLDLPQNDPGSKPLGAGPGSSCDSIWQIDAKAEEITGGCVQWSYPDNSMRFTWHLTRVGPPPALAPGG